MRALKFLPLLLLACACNEEPEVALRPETKKPTASADIELETSIRDSIAVKSEYLNFFHRFEVTTTSTENMEFGILHNDGSYSMGRRELGEFYNEYRVGDTLVVNFDVPFWNLFRLRGYVDVDKYHACSEAYINGDELTLRLYETEARGVYTPRAVVVVNSLKMLF